MSRRDPNAYARRNWRVLVPLFVLFVVFGLWADNIAALIGGAGGLVWIVQAHRGGE